MTTVAYQCDFRKYAALRAQENLFRIHPVEANTKKPLLRGYKSLATRNTRTLERWSEKFSDANVGGIIPARLVVLDIDARSGGHATLATLLREHGALERTVTVRTPSGGKHCYFYLSHDVELKTCTKIGAGLELLAKNSHVLLPGSIGANGKKYEYEISLAECNVALLPNWLLDLALAKQSAVSARLCSDRSDSFSLPSTIVEGERNRTLTSHAASLRARRHSEQAILRLLLQANRERCTTALDDKEVEKIAAWAASKEAGQTATAPDALAAFDALAAAITNANWSGRFAFNCRRVAESLLSLMREKGKTQVNAGARFLALRCGLSHMTVSRCLRALSGREKKKLHTVSRLFDCRVTRLRKDFVQLNKKTARYEQQTHCYSIAQHIVKLLHNSQARESGVELLCNRMTISHDAFRSRKGMSATRAVALAAIEQYEIHSAAELSERTSLTLVTAQRCLTELRKEALITKQKKRWQRTDLDLDAVAKKRGSLGATARQRAEYERERDNYEEVVLLRFLEDEERKKTGQRERMLQVVPAPDWGDFDERAHRRSTDEVRIAASLKKYSRAA